MHSIFINPIFILDDNNITLLDQSASINNKFKKDFALSKQFLEQYYYSPETIRSYLKEIERLLIWCIYLGKVNIAKLQAKHLIAYQQFLKNPKPKNIWCGSARSKQNPNNKINHKWRPFVGKLSASSIMKIYKILMIFFKYLVNQKYIINELVIKTYIPKKSKNKSNFNYLELNEVQAVLTALSDLQRQNKKHEFEVRRAKHVVLLLFYTGLSNIEIIDNSINNFVNYKQKWFLRLSNKKLLPVDPALVESWKNFKATINKANSFINKHQNQLYLRQDFFADVTMKCVQAANNAAENKLNKQEQKTHKQRKAAIKYLKKSRKSYQALINQIKKIIKSPVFTSKGKVNKIEKLLNQYDQEQSEQENNKEIKVFEETLAKATDDSDYFQIVESLSVKLQNRVSEVIQMIIFDEDEAVKKNLFKAIKYFIKKKGIVDKKAPIKLLNKNERIQIFNDKGSIKVPLYKSLLFIHLVNAIKSGEISLKYSYKYLSINKYLIDPKVWDQQSSNIIKQTGLTSFADFCKLMFNLKQKLNDKYEYVNNRINNNKNPYIKVNQNLSITIETPPTDKTETKYVQDLLEQTGFTPIYKVLAEINSITLFTKFFKHHNIKNIKYSPSAELFIAGILGLGSNIGIYRMHQISVGIKKSSLINTVKWYFNKGSLLNANDSILQLINQISLPKIFIEDPEILLSNRTLIEPLSSALMEPLFLAPVNQPNFAPANQLVSTLP